MKRFKLKRKRGQKGGLACNRINGQMPWVQSTAVWQILSRLLHRFFNNTTRCCFKVFDKMKRDDTRMTDIPSDVQKHILKLLATSNGASDFVRATSSCKEWKEFAEDSEILKTVQFGNKRASDILARKRKQDVLRLFIQRMKARDYKPDLLQSRNEVRRTRDFFSYGIS